MLCTAGHNNLDTAKFCAICGVDTFQQGTTSPMGSMNPSASMASINVQRTNGMAVASLVLGILGLFTSFFFFGISSILALIFGYVGRNKIRQTGENGSGMAIAGIVLGWIGVALAIIGIIVGIVAVNTLNHCHVDFNNNLVC